MLIYPMKIEPLVIESAEGMKRLDKYFGAKNAVEVEILSHGVKIAEGGYAGLSVGQLSSRYSAEFLGQARDSIFPFKMRVTASEARGVPTVHPESSLSGGKKGYYEMICILDSETYSGIYAGLKKEIEKDVFIDKITKGEIYNDMLFFYTSEDDSFLIPGGLLHCVGGGLSALYISVGSTGKYGTSNEYSERISDPEYMFSMLRANARGTKFLNAKENFDCGSSCVMDYSKRLAIKRIELNGILTCSTEETMKPLFITDGEGYIEAGGNRVKMKTGDTFIIPASAESFTLEGKVKLYLLADNI